ncbi:EboA domain-containing protein [Chitinophaga cymbidii]|uniref:EboA domain-containing protein n=1 Tax=Chitinophaga cymbidii TaxID=1096750 RepID=A0A512RFD5_9BACT|nr:EboA domain-containing protein [Chitinophaga cymbidii]GEP94415.1 hypothetical protein CCY01nite_06750 [Chitinophaga cymbidii]
MGYVYDERKVSTLLYQVILRHTPETAQKWLDGQLTAWLQQGAMQQFNLAFSAAPRFLGRAEVELLPEEKATLHPMVLNNYTLDRLFRVWWLLQLPVQDKPAYLRAIENLFLAAEMNEQVALYSALPLLAYPEEWTARTAEGIRSNIGVVLEAIMLDNPYPARYLDEPAWNQLVLKAFFTEKPVHRIVGLDERANLVLARTLIDLAHERWAAGRVVHPLLWRLVAPFIGETNFADIERVWHSEQHAEREAAALACFSSSYNPARELLGKRPEMAEDIATGKLTWETVARRING